jgi:hypothetical protein
MRKAVINSTEGSSGENLSVVNGQKVESETIGKFFVEI